MNFNLKHNQSWLTMGISTADYRGFYRGLTGEVFD